MNTCNCFPNKQNELVPTSIELTDRLMTKSLSAYMVVSNLISSFVTSNSPNFYFHILKY